MNIERKKYLQKLISEIDNGLIKVITGMRLSGKTHLLFTSFRNYLLESRVDDNQIIDISFDRLEDQKYRNPQKVYSYIKNRLKGDLRYFILLDEVQLLKNGNSVLNSLLRLPGVNIYVTSSDSGFLRDQILNEFGVQAEEIRLFPLCFSEFMSCFEGSRYDGWNEYILYGGLPAVVMIRDPEQKSAFLKRVFEEYFVTDLSSRHRIRNRDELRHFLKILSSRTGRMINPKQLSEIFAGSLNIRISQTTLKKYIDYMDDALLCSVARRYDIRNKKYISTPFKCYFSDPGLRNACLDFRQISESRGMENVIYNELLFRGFQVDTGVASFSGKNERGQVVRKQLDVNFMCSKNTRRYYIQSVFLLPDEIEMHQLQEPFRRIDDFFKRIIITKDCPAPYYTENGVLVMSIYDFLLNPDSLSF